MSAPPVHDLPAVRAEPFSELAAALVADGFSAARDERTTFIHTAAARGVSPTALSILRDEEQPEVIRQRAFGKLMVELANPVSAARSARSVSSDAA